ncbi:MAG: hypothetical protein A2114_01005 [Candidatus Vogelbacteria bacterium GWA1_51_14]|uniref:Uncharacterized protein n=1 Tax=Candidatus Vogelbacteria bacterium GWA1_51_14 TaxID=1802435 RepID=A0A1G2QBG3_9BACT|nr:MAG: hypothetical protein A2114_01005 [Candidatus Vogelbacteria bacterium GWA1_51_14]
MRFIKNFIVQLYPTQKIGFLLDTLILVVMQLPKPRKNGQILKSTVALIVSPSVIQGKGQDKRYWTIRKLN